MRTVTHYQTRKNLLHIEAPGVIINVYIGLRNKQGQEVTTVELICDDFADSKWRLPDLQGAKALIARVVRQS